MSFRSTLLALAFVLFSSQVLAKQATVKRNVILRSDSSTASQALEHLKVGAGVTLLDSAKQNGYYHVKAEDGQEGWVWGKNITVEGGTSIPSQPTTG